MKKEDPAEDFRAADEALNAADFEAAMLRAEKILAHSPDDPEALDIRGYCLLNLDRFQDALPLCERRKAERPFEYAYVLHKLGKNGQAETFISKLGADTRNEPGMRHLIAQIAYKLDKFRDSSRVYGQIMEDEKSWQGNEEVEEALKDNYSSILLLEKQYDRIVKLMSGGASLESVRAWQNLSVAYAELGFFENSVQALLEALKQQQSGEDKEELEKDGNDLEIQWLYLLQKISDARNLAAEEELVEERFYGEFVKRFKHLLQLRSVEFNNELMLVNNYAGLKRERLAAISKRLEKVLAKKDKIPLFMRVHIQVNAVLTLLKREKTKEAMALLKEVEGSHPEATAIDPRILLIRLDGLVREKKFEEAKGYLQKNLKAYSHDPLLSTLLLAQISLITKGTWEEAMKLLEAQLQSEQGKQLTGNLAFVIFMFRLLLKLHRREYLEGLLNTMADVQLPVTTYKYAVEAALSHGFYVQVIKLHDAHQKTHKVKGVEGAYLEALMQVDPEKALERDIDLSAQIDADELNGLFDKHFGTGKKGQAKAMKEVPGLEDRVAAPAEEAKKKRKKPKYPKGYDPANPGPPPDPERWLPKWQRSKYRKKHGGGGLLRGPQGGFQDVKKQTGPVEEVAVAKAKYGKKR